MKAITLHDKRNIEKFLRRQPFLYLYAIGDLDNFFWPYTTWYGLEVNRSVEQIVLLYTGTSLPVLLALAFEPTTQMKVLLQAIIHHLPRRFYAHLSANLAPLFAPAYHIQPHGTFYKMALLNSPQFGSQNTSAVIPLSSEHAAELEALYAESYPGNWFDPRMLETGYYFGIRRGAKIIAAAGVHVYSKQYKVAALGNIATHPEFRGQGLATAVSAKLCHALMENVDHIGLNVSVDNTSAIACYRKLGFKPIAAYEEFTLAEF